MEDFSHIDEESFPLINREEQNEDYDNVDPPQERETSFSTPNSSSSAYTTPLSSKTATVMSREITRQKIASLYRHLGVEGDVGVNIDRFRTQRNDKLGFTILEFDKTGRGDWINLTNKRTGEFLMVSSLKTVFGGRVAMQNMLGLETTPPGIEKSISSARQLLDITPTDLEMESMSNKEILQEMPKIIQLSRDAETNTDFDNADNLRDIKGLDAALTSIRSEMTVGVAKLDFVDKKIEHQKDKIKAISGPEYDNENGKKLREREQRFLREFQEERRLRIETLSKHRKELSKWTSRLRELGKELAGNELTPMEKLKLLF